MKVKYLNREIEIKAVEDNGFFSGYASVFEELDSYRDIVNRGAFKRSLSNYKKNKRFVPILWQHKHDEVIGVYKKIEEDERGLYVEGEINLDVQRAREAYSLLKQGAVSGISIGYSTIKQKYDSERSVNYLIDIELYEASLVTTPACDSARVDEVRSALIGGEMPSLPEFESFLREAGFSRTQAKAIANKGLAHLLPGREVGSDVLNNLHNSLKELKWTTK